MLLLGPKHSSPTDNPVSLTYGKYDDMRMPWVGIDSGKPRDYAITDASQEIAPMLERRVWLVLTNDGPNPIYLGLGEAAVANRCLRLNANGGAIMLNRHVPWPDRIFAICGAGLTSTLLVADVSQIVEDGRGE